jgi:cytochrome oxidase Cu insertion factor (SCO1/SenC/PrrC family)
MKHRSASFLLVVLLLAGCEPTPTGNSPQPPKSNASANRLSPGSKAPDVSGVDLDGVAFKLSDYKGKVVMLDFWGSW